MAITTKANAMNIPNMPEDDGVHKLLRGGRPPYPNSLSAKQMESLSAICDTFLPSMVPPSSSEDDGLVEFYGTSASMAGVPEHVKHPAIGALRFVLWLLSTWWGTFLLCGRRSLSGKFPYFQKFSDIKPECREDILLSWSLSSFFGYKMMFKCLKYGTMHIYFSKVDEKNKNPSWKALDYCGPDPRFAEQQSPQQEQPVKEGTASFGTLHKHVVDATTLEETLIEAFHQTGISATPSSTSPLTVHCDAVVIGSGAGGSVVAAVLAKAGQKVIVLEKGRYFAGSALSLLEGPSTDQMYEGSGLLATDTINTVVLAGATVGGGTTINWSASIRTPPHVLKEWCDKHDLKLFGSGGFNRALDIVCERMGVQPDIVIDEEGFSNAVLRRGCLELGYPVSSVPRNAPPDHHCGWCHMGCRDGRKQSASETWLTDMAKSGNGIIVQCCRALRVTTRSDHKGRRTATGVLAEAENGERTILFKSKVTVVASGALSTPPLLRRSGLKNSHIGRHLHLHPAVMAWGYFPKRSGTWPEEGKKSFEGGIITSMSTVLANFDTSGYGVVVQTPVLHPGMFSVLTPWVSAKDFRERMVRFPRTAHLFALVRDTGSGYTREYPNSLTYKANPGDEENLKRGVGAALRILAAAGAEEIGTHQREGEVFDVRKGSRDELEEFAREASGRKLKDMTTTPTCSAHQMGSCRMGKDPGVSAVSPRGETWEVEGLFVADSSVFPTAVGVNPMVTVQAIAYCTAQSVVEALQRKN